MNTKSIGLFLIIAVFVGFLFGRISEQKKIVSTTSEATQATEDTCVADDCLAISDLSYPVGELSPEVATALRSALDDEYKAWATYDAVIAEFGSTRPFIMIQRAEEQHIASLKALFDKYGLEVPDNTWRQKVTVPATLQAACQTGVDAEVANAALYREELLPVVKDYPDITQVFSHLMQASEDKHLPAFQRCS